MLRRVFVLVALASVLEVRPGLAVRLEFVAQYKGERVAGTEVCFWRAGEETDPLALYASSDDLNCMSADDVLEIPVGRWLYILRREDDLVYMQPSVITNSAHSMDERGYKRDIAEMRPAGILELNVLQQGAEESLALYVSNDRSEARPMLVPIPRNTTRMTVPAEMELVILAVSRGKVTRASAPFVVEGGSIRRVSQFSASNQRGAVVAWVTFPDSARKPADYWERLGAPQAILERAGEAIEPLLPLLPSYLSDGALLLFREVPPGHWTIRLRGSGWRSDEIPVDVTPGILNAPRVLHTAPVASLRVRWSVGSAIVQDQFCAPPRDADSRPSTPTVRLLTCPGLQPGLPAGVVDRARCRQTSDTPETDARARTALFAAVNPGTYLVEVREPSVPTRRAIVTLAIGEPSAVDLDLKTFNFYGRLMMDGKPVAARLEFATGYAVSDESGNYQARLEDVPRLLRVRVVRCEDNRLLYTEFPPAPIQPNAAHDIDIRSNRIRVRVVDAETQQPLEGAEVSCGVSTGEDDQGEFLPDLEPTDVRGEAVIANVAIDRRLLICAEAAKYQRQCAEQFVIGSAADRTAVLALARLQYRGKLLVPLPVDRARVDFIAADGRELEKADVKPDGTFDFHYDHRAPEYVVVTGAALPLFVAPLPGETPEILEIARRTGPIQSIRVSISHESTRRNALIGIVIGGRYVPDGPFSEHQSRHGQQAEVLGKGPLLIPAILASGVIDIILGPEPQEYPADVPFGVDIFTLPQYRQQFPLKRVGVTGSVVFE